MCLNMCAIRRARPRSMPTEHADGPRRRTTPKKHADQPSRRSTPMEHADETCCRIMPTEHADGARRRHAKDLSGHIRNVTPKQ